MKSVPKNPLEGRICSCTWSGDGRFVAIGMFNGTVSIREPGENNEVVRGQLLITSNTYCLLPRQPSLDPDLSGLSILSVEREVAPPLSCWLLDPGIRPSRSSIGRGIGLEGSANSHSTQHPSPPARGTPTFLWGAPPEKYLCTLERGSVLDL